YGDGCAYCETGEFEELEHYTPVKAGGPHTLENVRPSCSACNRAKSDADPEEWLAEQAEFDALTEDEQNALIDAEIAKYLNEDA
ncbi:HNH endonuclease signature motif containing protein, partial [Rhodoplanes serenus]|uniref:HNH endonuclease signature motif containing protein n=1 Tax=Rhodoplanes serenus TaxID=200615 RepID=UPI000DBBF004